MSENDLLVVQKTSFIIIFWPPGFSVPYSMSIHPVVIKKQNKTNPKQNINQMAAHSLIAVSDCCLTDPE